MTPQLKSISAGTVVPATTTKEAHDQFTSVPKALKEKEQWVCYKLIPDKAGKKPKKIPVNPVTGANAKSDDPSTWGTFEQAVEAMQTYHYAGIGFMLTSDCGVVGVDIDHCYDPETDQFNEVAKDILPMQPTYAEFSPSGDGVHLWFSGEKTFRGCRNSETGVEVYDHGRYLTVTGKPLDGVPSELAKNSGTLEAIHDKYIVKQKKEPEVKKTAAEKREEKADATVLDQALLSKDGEVIARLIDGEWVEDYPSQSEADLALCKYLSLHTKDPTQIDRLFRKSKLYRDKWDEVHFASGETYGHETIAMALDVDTSKIKGTLLTGVFEQAGRYYCCGKTGAYEITNFIVVPVEMIEAADGTEAYITAIFVPQNSGPVELTIAASEFASLPKFKNRLSAGTISLCFYGSDKDLERLKNYLNGLDWKRKKGVKPIGIQFTSEGPAFVSTAKAVLAGSKVSGQIIQLKGAKSIESGILDVPLLPKEALLELGKVILSYNIPARTVPVLAWCSACFLKPLLHEIGIKFPYLVISGEAGSGKSTTVEQLIKRVFSVSKSLGASQISRFTLAKELASSNLIPAILDEYKPSKMTAAVKDVYSNALRDDYDGHTAVRGKPDGSVVEYQYLAPIVLAGESGIDEPAIKERIIDVVYAKKEIKTKEYAGTDKCLLEQAEEIAMLGRSLLEEALYTTKEQVKEWHDVGKAVLRGSFPPRVLSNYACLYVGLMFFQAMLERYGLIWDDVLPIAFSNCVEALEYSATNYLLDEGKDNPSVIDRLLEIMSRSKLDRNIDYVLDESKGILCLRLREAYDKTLKYIREHGLSCETLSEAQFQRQLKNCEYFLESNVSLRFPDKTIRKVWKLDYAKLSEKAEVEDFQTAPSYVDAYL